MTEIDKPLTVGFNFTEENLIIMLMTLLRLGVGDIVVDVARFVNEINNAEIFIRYWNTIICGILLLSIIKKWKKMLQISQIFFILLLAVDIYLVGITFATFMKHDKYNAFQFLSCTQAILTVLIYDGVLGYLVKNYIPQD